MLSRIFGIFSEEIVRLWCAHPEAPYDDLGRPALRGADKSASTLDFSFQRRHDGAMFVGELKCELEYQGYRYMVLENCNQLTHHNKEAFAAFLRAARSPGECSVSVKGKEIVVEGAILVWGDATAEGRQAVMQQYLFADVLTVADVLRDLNRWNSPRWRDFISERRAWVNEMFDGLVQGAERERLTARPRSTGRTS
jgi:hypothetical protein